VRVTEFQKTKNVKKLGSTLARMKIGRIFIPRTKEVRKCVKTYKSKIWPNVLTNRMRMVYLMTLVFMENQKMKPIVDLTYSFSPALLPLEVVVNAQSTVIVGKLTPKNLERFKTISARQILL
jgi:hypothetical protein